LESSFVAEVPPPLALGPLAVWRHSPENRSPLARILLIHGLSEHSGRHQNTIRFLTAQGYEVIRFDLRGAGRSGGKRQWCEYFEEYVEDTVRVFNWMSAELSPLPLFLLGHSLGGAIGIYFAADYGKSLQGLILSATGYLPGPSISPWKIKLGKLLGSTLPGLRVPGSRDKSDLSRDPAVGEEFLRDPLTCQFNTIQQGVQILKALPRLPSLCRRITVPVLMFHGDADRVVKVEGTQELFLALASRDKKLHIFPNGYHEPHQDLNKEEYFSLLGNWIDHHLIPQLSPEKDHPGLVSKNVSR